jgi:hypothetical protein
MPQSPVPTRRLPKSSAVASAPDERWVHDELTPLRNVKGKDFEVVKIGLIKTR